MTAERQGYQNSNYIDIFGTFDHLFWFLYRLLTYINRLIFIHRTLGRE